MTFKEVLKSIGWLFGGVLLLMAVMATLNLGGLSWQRFAAPFAEETRAQTYENSRTYNQGMANDLADLCRQYRAEEDPIFKAGIGNQVLQRADRYDWDKLPSQTRRCVEEIDANYSFQMPVG